MKRNRVVLQLGECWMIPWERMPCTTVAVEMRPPRKQNLLTRSSDWLNIRGKEGEWVKNDFSLWKLGNWINDHATHQKFRQGQLVQLWIQQDWGAKQASKGDPCCAVRYLGLSTQEQLRLEVSIRSHERLDVIEIMVTHKAMKWPKESLPSKQKREMIFSPYAH